ncbi:NADH-ubiquinone oxidoreductase 40 kDa subunit mitochondrial precursor [Kalaharituber pfeilii]|nr:NADH-ubiquinone oxidoreductase 40 kDa subunit mitochondrial precursor [Kalaharituber pfeilii]
MTKRHLKPTGDLGRVVFLEFDLRNTESIEESVRHSDIVYNLIGRQYTTKNFTYEDVHVEGTQRITEAVAKYDVDRYVHVSTYNADPKSHSAFFATKGRGEQEARAIFPETTIVRPAPMYGYEDWLLNWLGRSKVIVTANHMQQKYWPVHVLEVAKALEQMMYDDSTAGQTFELYGPKEYSTRQIADLIDKETLRKRRNINLPKPVYLAIARALDYIWWPTISPDEVEREFINQVIDPNAKTFKDLGFEPEDLTRWILHYVRQYRSNLYYDLPPMTEKEVREERKYLHVDYDL